MICKQSMGMFEALFKIRDVDISQGRETLGKLGTRVLGLRYS